MALNVAIKNRLQEWIDEMNLNYTRVAEITGVHVQTVRRVAKNQSDRLDIETMRAICVGLNKSVSDFWYDDEEGDR